MLQLARLAPAPAAAVFAKLEFLNPGGSIKDRAALGMILDAEARGLLHRGSTIIEATAGNTGVGLALIGVNRGYSVKLSVPEGFAEEKCILDARLRRGGYPHAGRRGHGGSDQAGARGGGADSWVVYGAAVSESSQSAVSP